MVGVKLAVIVAVLAALPSLSLGTYARVGPAECRESYQNALSEAIRIREECDIAAYYDCCQAKQVASCLQTGPHMIGEACEPEVFSKPTNMIARCDMDTDGGGWMVIQRRVNDSTFNFTRNWKDYEDGFGYLDGEFWYGLKKLHCLTNRDEVELRIDLKDEHGVKLTWIYEYFHVANCDDKYRLSIGQGVAIPATYTYDHMAYHNGQQFTTYDNDNDGSRGNCALNSKGGWWYNSCYAANLNGVHDGSGYERILLYNRNTRGITVYPYTEMKIRPKACTLKRRAAYSH